MAPKNRSEARNWNFYNKLDAFYPIRQWPQRYQSLGMQAHLNHSGSYKLYTLFVFNGMDPSIAGSLLRDKHAVEQREITDLHKSLKLGKFNNHKGTYDFELARMGQR